MKKVDLSSLDIQKYLNSIDIDKIGKSLKALKPRKYKVIIDNLEDIIKLDIDILKIKYLNICDSFSDDERKDVEKVFSYTSYRKKEKFMEHFKKLNIKSCPFCNNNYIYFYKKSASKYNALATLEHFYPKAQYPHLSLSFYNLVSSCSICNSKFKGTKKHVGKIHHPYRDDFDNNATFSLSVNTSAVTKDTDLNIHLKSNDAKCKKSIERFQLDKVYEEHRDIAKEIWNKTQVYNDSRIDELYNSFYKALGYEREDVKSFIYCNYLDKDDINKRNHTKLTQDILKQFELINKIK